MNMKRSHFGRGDALTTAAAATAAATLASPRGKFFPRTRYAAQPIGKKATQRRETFCPDILHRHSTARAVLRGERDKGAHKDDDREDHARVCPRGLPAARDAEPQPRRQGATPLWFLRPPPNTVASCKNESSPSKRETPPPRSHNHRRCSLARE